MTVRGGFYFSKAPIRHTKNIIHRYKKRKKMIDHLKSDFKKKIQDMTPENTRAFAVGCLANLFKRVNFLATRKGYIPDVDKATNTVATWLGEETRKFRANLRSLKGHQAPKLEEFDFFMQAALPLQQIQGEGKCIFWLGYYFRWGKEMEEETDAATCAKDVDGYNPKLANTRWDQLTLPGQKMERRTLTLDQQTIDIARQYGNNASDGIRALVRIGAESIQKKEEQV
jgi:hypothetical protein